MSVNAVLAFLLSKSAADYDASCVSLRDVAEGCKLSGARALEFLDALTDKGLAEYHRPREAAAYWRASNKARREAVKP